MKLNFDTMKKGGILISIRISSAILAYLVVIIFARVMSSSDFGHFTLILSGVAFAGAIARLGMNVVVIRYLGAYRTQEHPDLAAGLVSFAVRSVGLFSAAIALAAAGLFITFPQSTGEPYAYALAAILIFPAFAFNEVLGGILRSYGSLVAALAPRDVFWRVTKVVVVGGAFWMGYGAVASLKSVVLVSGLALTFITILQYRASRYLVRKNSEGVARSYSDIGMWKKSMLPVWISSMSDISFRTLDVLVVGIVLSASDAGMYFAANRTAELLNFMLVSLGYLVGPAISRGAVKGDVEGVQRKLSLVSLSLFLFCAPLALIFFVFGKDIMELINIEFGDAYWALVFLSIGQCANVAVGSSGIVLNMTGNEAVNMRIVLTTSPLTALLLLVLVPEFGISGAAVAAASGVVILNVRLWLAAVRLTPYDPSLLGIRYLMKRHEASA